MSLLSTSRIVDELRAGGGRPTTRATPDASRTLNWLMQLAAVSSVERNELDSENFLSDIVSRSVLRTLLTAVAERSPHTVRHSRRVALLSVALGQHLGWEGRPLQLLEVAALLHDFGKVGVPETILSKPAKLNADEREMITLNHHIGIDILQACGLHCDVIDLIAQSHRMHLENEAPTSGRDPHQGARILAVADAYESLNTDQSYRAARPHDEIMRILNDAAGAQFDGNIVAALGRFVQLHGSILTGQDDAPTELDGWQEAEVGESSETTCLREIFSYLYMLESLYDGFTLVDSGLKLLVWNRGAENLLDRKAREILGSTWSRETLNYCDLSGRPLSEPECPMAQVFQGAGSITSEVQLTRADGRALRVELQTIPLRDDFNQLLGVVEIFRDLTRNGPRRPREFRELQLAATRDALTSVANRGELETQLTALVGDFARPGGNPFSIIFVDADHFKNVNDTYGHAVGDQVLIDLARLLQKETYSGELVARYGGEEFVVLCPGTELEQAVRRAERLRSTLRLAKVGGVARLRVTASFGVTQVEPGDSAESVLRRADKALYTAKHTGRDRTCWMTNAQLLSETGGEQESNDSSGPLECVAHFSTPAPGDIITLKLKGYVEAMQARLLEVTPSVIRLRLGGLGWFGYWGSTPDTQGIELEVSFENALGARDPKARSTTKNRVTVRVRPMGRLRDRSLFAPRAGNAIRDLKQFFAAE